MLLWHGLKDSQLWVRMAALRGLVTFGKRPSIEVLQQALGDGRSDQLANYLLRYSVTPGPVDAYLARALIKLLDAKGRQSAIKIIEGSTDSLRDLYRLAAYYDPAPSMQAYIAGSLERRPIAPTRVDKLTAVLTGERSPYLEANGTGETTKAGEFKSTDWEATQDLEPELEALGLGMDTLTNTSGFETLGFDIGVSSELDEGEMVAEGLSL